MPGSGTTADEIIGLFDVATDCEVLQDADRAAPCCRRRRTCSTHCTSRLATAPADPQGLVDAHAGTGQQVGNIPAGQPGSKERVDFGNKVIGKYVNPVTGEKIPTTTGIIHYGSKGVHIVPSKP
ncbi:polymorphic toxin type 50 domain-containing protein [Rhizobium ruizarguesonis]